MVKIAITGGIACGKSLAGCQLAAMGYSVCEADDIAREVLAPGTGTADRVMREFGSGVVGGDGAIDRAALAREVFGDARKRARLNALTHPEILKRLRGWICAQDPGTTCVVAVIPLLYEAGDAANWDAVICVAAPEAEQRRRLLARGLSAEDADARIRAQLPQEAKMERADYVVFNGGTEGLLREQLDKVMRTILGG